MKGVIVIIFIYIVYALAILIYFSSLLLFHRMSAQYRYLYFVYALKNISVKYESK